MTKTILIAGFIFQIILSFTLYSGNPEASGIYMNIDDYKSRKLSLQVDCKSEKHKIMLHDFLNKPYIDVIHEGKKYTYQKSEIFGFRDCDGNDYRFVTKSEYKIIESKSITLYEIESLKSNPSGKGAIMVKEYYFSLSPDSETIPLTIENIKKSFPDNHPLHDQMDANFKYDEDIIAYDSFHKMYKINWLIQENKK